MQEGDRQLHGRTIELSSLDREMFPARKDGQALTKGDLVAFYDRVAERMMPYVESRPVATKRWPSGIDGESFFQKNAGQHFPDWITRAEIAKREGGSLDHVVVEEPATIAYLANQNAVELHGWLATLDDLDHPDLFVVDLDPPEGSDVDAVRSAARAVRDLLDEVGLTGCLKTSGSKGFHVLVPLDRSTTWDQARGFGGAFAAVLAQRHPDELTDEHRKDQREGRVYIDVARNNYGQTTVVPYSVRGLPGAPVSTPIDWDELGRVEPRTYTVGNLFRRLAQKDDPWAGTWQPVSLDAAAGRLHDLLGP